MQIGFLTSLNRRIRGFGRDRRGIAAVEFAMLLPVMLLFYFGVVEVAQALMVKRKVTSLTRTIGDLTAQSSSIADGDMNNIFDAAQTVMMPYTGVAPKMNVASVVIDDNGVARVCWSAQRNSTAPGRGSTVTLPADLRVPGTSLIIARASYDFTPTIGYVITGTITMGDDPIYMRPRNGKAGGTGAIEQVARDSVAMCPGYG